MNKNRSVVIVRYNDAIDGVLCKERHFVRHRSPLHIRCLALSHRCCRICRAHWYTHIVPMFLARLFNNFDCVRILGGRMRYAFNLFILFFFSCNSVCMCFFSFFCLLFIWLFANDRMRQAVVLFSFLFPCLPCVCICRRCDQIPCRLKIIASIVCFW